MQLDTPTTSKRFEFIDGLRGIAAMLVVLLHFNTLYNENHIKPFPEWLNFLFNQGHLGVEIFFILSGFVIAYSLRNKNLSFPFIGNFFVKRALRLDPPFWIVISMLVGLGVIGNIFKSTPSPLPSFQNIIANLFYLTEFFEVPRILPVSWTLALEIQFYMFLILMLKLVYYLDQRYMNREKLSWLSLCLVGTLMGLSLLQATPYALIPHVPGLFIFKWYSFFVGTLVCWRMLNKISEAFLWFNFSALLLCALTVDVHIFTTLGIALFIYVVVKFHKMHSLFSSSYLQFLGRISYSLYLMHWVVGLKFIDFAIRFLGTKMENQAIAITVMIVAISVAIAASTFFYQMIELPSLKLSQKFSFSKKNPKKIMG